MQKILSVIGALCLIVVFLYFAVVTPVNKYSELEIENSSLKKQLKEAQEATQTVYKQFDSALHSHLNEEQINNIYSDVRYFQKVDTEICVKSDTNDEIINYSRLN